MSRSIVLSLCDRTGVMVRPWAEAGWECWCVDAQHPGDTFGIDGIRRIGADLNWWLPPREVDYRIVFAFPPCTHLAVSGARWFRDKGLTALAEGLGLVERCRRICEWSGAPYCIENPVGMLSSYWRKPDHTFQPWHYGDNEQKATCLWTGGGFVMPDPTVTVRPADVRQSVWLCPPSEDRGNIRSVTPAGFARAVFDANARARAAGTGGAT